MIRGTNAKFATLPAPGRVASVDAATPRPSVAGERDAGVPAGRRRDTATEELQRGDVESRAGGRRPELPARSADHRRSQYPSTWPAGSLPGTISYQIC